MSATTVAVGARTVVVFADIIRRNSHWLHPSVANKSVKSKTQQKNTARFDQKHISMVLIWMNVAALDSHSDLVVQKSPPSKISYDKEKSFSFSSEEKNKWNCALCTWTKQINTKKKKIRIQEADFHVFICPFCVWQSFWVAFALKSFYLFWLSSVWCVVLWCELCLLYITPKYTRPFHHEKKKHILLQCALHLSVIWHWHCRCTALSSHISCRNFIFFVVPRFWSFHCCKQFEPHRAHTHIFCILCMTLTNDRVECRQCGWPIGCHPDHREWDVLATGGYDDTQMQAWLKSKCMPRLAVNNIDEWDSCNSNYSVRACEIIHHIDRSNALYRLPHTHKPSNAYEPTKQNMRTSPRYINSKCVISFPNLLSIFRGKINTTNTQNKKKKTK